MEKYPKTLKQKPRKFKKVVGAEGVFYVLDNYIGYNDLYYHTVKRNYKLKLEKKDNGKVEIQFPPAFNTKSIEDTFYIFSVKKRYIKYEFLRDQVFPDNRVLAIPKAVYISEEERKEPRYLVKDNLVYAHAFKISKSKIEVEERKRSISTEVIFKEYQKKLGNKYQFVEIDFFDIKRVIEEPYKTIYKTQKVLFIPNTDDLTSGDFSSDNEKFLPLDESLSSHIGLCKKREIKSEIIYPVIYEKIDGSRVPIGYIRVASKDNNFSLEDLEFLDNISKEMVEKIRDANLANIDVKQEIKNVSSSGMCLLITDKELMKFVPDRDAMIFTVVFKLQPPLVIYGQIVYVLAVNPNTYEVGIKFKGEGGGKKSLKLFRKYLEVFKKRFDEIKI